MDDGFQMRVVVVEDVTGYAVDEGRIHDVEPLRPAEQSCLRAPGEGRER
jgi:hypothetical protein